MNDPDEHHEDPEGGAGRPSRPSMTPSWVMLGFAAGMLFMWLIRATVGEVVPSKPNPVEPPPVRTPTPPVPADVEAVFAEYSEYAHWENNLTEIVLWNRAAQALVDRFEIRRVGDTYYFRTIPKLTRRVLNHGVPENLPIQFTETEAEYQQWLRDVAQENQRQGAKSLIEALGGRRAAPTDVPPSPPAQANPVVQPPAGGR